MDFQRMKRKELQALCKKHKIPANLSNLEMAKRLTEIFKENENSLIQGLINGQDENASETESTNMVMNRKVKKVRFSPEHELIEFTRSPEIKQSTRRNSVSVRNSSQMNSQNVDKQGRVTRSRGLTLMEEQVNEKKRGREGVKFHEQKNNASTVENLNNRELREGNVDGMSRVLQSRGEKLVEGVKNARKRGKAKEDGKSDTKALDDEKSIEEIVDSPVDSPGRLTRSRGQNLAEVSVTEVKIVRRVVKIVDNNVPLVSAETDDNRVVTRHSSRNRERGLGERNNGKKEIEVLEKNGIAEVHRMIEPQILVRSSKRNANAVGDSQILNDDMRKQENRRIKGSRKSAKLLAADGLGVDAQGRISKGENYGRVLQIEEPVKPEVRRSKRRKEVIKAETENTHQLRSSVPQLVIAGEVSKNGKKVPQPIMRRSRRKTTILEPVASDGNFDTDAVAENSQTEKRLSKEYSVEKGSSVVQKNTRKSRRIDSVYKSLEIIDEQKNESRKRKRGPISEGGVVKTINDPSSQKLYVEERRNKKGVSIAEAQLSVSEGEDSTSNPGLISEKRNNNIISDVGLMMANITSHTEKQDVSIADSADTKSINRNELANSDENSASRIKRDSEDFEKQISARNIAGKVGSLEFDVQDKMEQNTIIMDKSQFEAQLLSQIKDSSCINTVDSQILQEGLSVSGNEGFAETSSSADCVLLADLDVTEAEADTHTLSGSDLVGEVEGISVQENLDTVETGQANVISSLIARHHNDVDHVDASNSISVDNKDDRASKDGEVGASESCAEQPKSPSAITTAITNTLGSSAKTGHALCINQANDQGINSPVVDWNKQPGNDAQCGKDKDEFADACITDVDISTGLHEKHTVSVVGEKPNDVESIQIWTEIELSNLFETTMLDVTPTGLNYTTSQGTERANLIMFMNKSDSNSGNSFTTKKEKYMEGGGSESAKATYKNEFLPDPGSGVDREDNQFKLLFATPIKIDSPSKADESSSHEKKLDRADVAITECAGTTKENAVAQMKSDEKVRVPENELENSLCLGSSSSDIGEEMNYEVLSEVESVELVKTSSTIVPSGASDEHVTENTCECLKKSDFIKEKNTISSSGSLRNLDKLEGCQDMPIDTDLSENLSCGNSVCLKSERKVAQSIEAAFELFGGDIQKSNVLENSHHLTACYEESKLSETLIGTSMDAEVENIGRVSGTTPSPFSKASNDGDEVTERKGETVDDDDDDDDDDDPYESKIRDEKDDNSISFHDISDEPHFNTEVESLKSPSVGNTLELQSTRKETGTITQNILDTPGASETTGLAMCMFQANDQGINSPAVEGSNANEDGNDAHCGKDKDEFAGACITDVDISMGLHEKLTVSVVGEKPNDVESIQSWKEIELSNLFETTLHDVTPTGLNDTTSQGTERANQIMCMNKSDANSDNSLTNNKEKEMEGERGSQSAKTSNKNTFLPTDYKEVSDSDPGSGVDREDNQFKLLFATPIKIDYPSMVDKTSIHEKKLVGADVSITECVGTTKENAVAQIKSDEKVRVAEKELENRLCLGSSSSDDSGEEINYEESNEAESVELVNASTIVLSEASKEHLTENTCECLKKSDFITEGNREENIIYLGEPCLYEEARDKVSELKEKNTISSSGSPRNLDKLEGCQDMLIDIDLTKNYSCGDSVYLKSERKVVQCSEAQLELSDADVRKSNVLENSHNLTACYEESNLNEILIDTFKGPMDAAETNIGGFNGTSPSLFSKASNDNAEIIERHGERRDDDDDDPYEAKMLDEKDDNSRSFHDTSDEPHCNNEVAILESPSVGNTVIKNVDNLLPAAEQGLSVCGAEFDVFSSLAAHLLPGDNENSDSEKSEAGTPVYNSESDHEKNSKEVEETLTATKVQLSISELYSEQKIVDSNEVTDNENGDIEKSDVGTPLLNLEGHHEKNDEEVEENLTDTIVQFPISELNSEEKFINSNNDVPAVFGCNVPLKESDVADTIKEYIDSELARINEMETCEDGLQSVERLGTGSKELEEAICVDLNVGGYMADKSSVETKSEEHIEEMLFKEPLTGPKTVHSPVDLVENSGSAGSDALVPEKEEIESEDGHRSSSRQLCSTAKKNVRTILIHGTPNKVMAMADMKENAPTHKSSNIGDLTAVRPAKRKALQDVQWK